MLRIFRWLQGYVLFTISGRYPERFINVVTKNNLAIWDTGKTNGVLCACMYVRDYRYIKALARKGRATLRIRDKRGLPFFIRKHKNRVGVVAGVAIFALIVMFMSNFIWSIEVTGLSTVSEAQILKTLEKNGLYIGAFKPTSSFNITGRDTMLDIGKIGWMSVNVTGSHASVEVKEKALSPTVDDYHQPANVKARCDGLILSMNVKEGESMLINGSAVVKDQLIVSGVMEDQLGGVKLVRADAEIIARTRKSKTFTIDKNHPLIVCDNKKSRYTLSVFGLSFPLSFSFADDSNCAIRYRTDALCFLDTVVPLSVTTGNLYEYQYGAGLITEELAQASLLNCSRLYEGFELSESTVISRKTEFSQTDTKYILTASYVCEENIAYQQDIGADNVVIENVKPQQENTR